MEWMLMPLRRYADFQGRSRRKEYWMYALFVILIYFVAGIVFVTIAGGALFAAMAAGTAPGMGSLMAMGGASIVILLIALVWLVLFIPSLAVAFRRLHDTDHSGWWALAPTALSIVGLVAGGADATVSLAFSAASFIASFVLLVFFLIEGTRGPNRFGADPKDPAGDLAQVFS